MRLIFLAIPILGLFVLHLVGPASAQTNQDRIQTEHIMADIRELSSLIYGGRQAGTDGGNQSAYYVVQRFQKLGLQPAYPTTSQQSSSTWIQQSPLRAPQIQPPILITLSPTGTKNKRISFKLEVGKDFLPILDSPSVNVTAPVVFVAYGIVDPARGVDHYQGVDVHNRIVLFLRGKPPAYSQWVTHEQKAHIAKEKGAAAYLTVTGQLLNRYQARKGLGQIPLAIYATSPEDRPIPGAWISGTDADSLFQTLGISLEDLQQTANHHAGNPSRALPLVAHLRWHSRVTPGRLSNVLGVIPGSHPIGKKETIVIGAHRDHFGTQAGLQFPGADDNASGTAIMLEIARLLTSGSAKPQRTILFISFDGEERGLLGSKQYVHNPVLPLDKTMAMINLDHVGVGDGTLTVGVTRLEKSIAKHAAKQAGLTEKIKLYGYFPGGDHVPFYEAEVPTITIVSAGVHPHFHQPSDTPETINAEILKTAASFVLSLLDVLANPND